LHHEGKQPGVGVHHEQARDLVGNLDVLLRREISVVGSYETGVAASHPYWPWSRARNHATVIDLIRRGELDVRPLISHIVPYRDAPAIYDMLAAGGEGWLSVAFTWTE